MARLTTLRSDHEGSIGRRSLLVTAAAAAGVKALPFARTAGRSAVPEHVRDD